jgi:hypothetical protein
MKQLCKIKKPFYLSVTSYHYEFKFSKDNFKKIVY